MPSPNPKMETPYTRPWRPLGIPIDPTTVTFTPTVLYEIFQRGLTRSLEPHERRQWDTTLTFLDLDTILLLQHALIRRCLTNSYLAEEIARSTAGHRGHGHPLDTIWHHLKGLHIAWPFFNPTTQRLFRPRLLYSTHCWWMPDRPTSHPGPPALSLLQQWPTLSRRGQQAALHTLSFRKSNRNETTVLMSRLPSQALQDWTGMHRIVPDQFLVVPTCPSSLSTTILDRLLRKYSLQTHNPQSGSPTTQRLWEYPLLAPLDLTCPTRSTAYRLTLWRWLSTQHPDTIPQASLPPEDTINQTLSYGLCSQRLSLQDAHQIHHWMTCATGHAIWYPHKPVISQC